MISQESNIADIPTMFNKAANRARAPSVVVTSDNLLQQATNLGASQNVPVHHIHHSDSVTSSQPSQHEMLDTSAIQPNGNGCPRGTQQMTKFKACTKSVCSKSARKIYFGTCVTICVTASWVGATHCIKYLYLKRSYTNYGNYTTNGGAISLHPLYASGYNAPFFTTWFSTNFTILFFPLFFLYGLIVSGCQTPSDMLVDSIRSFREKGFTVGRFLTRCSLFCLLWVATNYMYIRSLRVLLATDVIALFATNVTCAYLLSWVILHEQFVGIRIFAVILCDTGVALLAYMDGITGSPTLNSVVLATFAAAGSAAYKVLFKKIIGEATYGQVALFFSIIGLLNAALLWPICIALYFTGVESFFWDQIPWFALLCASVLSLMANLLGNFSVALTYDLFITLGLITSVPVSAALDVIFYGARFAGMKLAGIILIATGFFLVMFPNNWPDYITRLLRNIIIMSHSTRWSRRNRNGISGTTGRRELIDYRTGYIRSNLRSPSGRVR